ncbi:2-oxoacid:ferredoxin oxidoreductase subunit beta [Eubacteriaceae bacterium ES3]|nr:2-oxoacid:ferredoxin oxidoreductase subunit beta [Eubacteriaceae bacterium ES3]
MTKYQTYETAWCPGCGNFSILDCLKTALEELELEPHKVLMVAGIGQAAKIPQYINANAFCGLHGRALPPAVAAKMVNEELTVIVSTGDGDTYGEGGNHFIHNVRRNVDIAHFVHDNQVYGLTKGQSSPTSGIGFVTGVQPSGNINTPLNPLLMALAAGAGFVARGFSGHKQHLVSLMKQAIEYKGYAIIDILQPCVSFNKINTYQWYNQRVYELDKNYDSSDKIGAIQKTMEFGETIPLGVLYKEEMPTFNEKNEVLKNGPLPLNKDVEAEKLENLINEFI